MSTCESLLLPLPGPLSPAKVTLWATAACPECTVHPMLQVCWHNPTWLMVVGCFLQPLPVVARPGDAPARMAWPLTLTVIGPVLQIHQHP